jgi:nitrogen fixation protein NifB
MSQAIDHEPAPNFCSSDRRSSGRVHLPIAPRALARVRFSPEKPLPRALSPDQALTWLHYLVDRGEFFHVVNLGGPGDPLATPELTLQTLELLRRQFSDLSLCLTTLGLGAGPVAGALAGFGLAHVSILMEAMDPKVVERIYAWIRPGTRTLPLPKAARVLVREQAAAVTALVEQGIPVQFKTTVYPGINSAHIPTMARRGAKLGVGQMKLFPFEARDDESPRPAEVFGPKQLQDLAGQAGQYLPARFMDPVTCRAALEWDPAESTASKAVRPGPSPQRPYLAVCSSDGFEVDLHLGQADQYLIYGPQDGPVVLLETRPAPGPGGGDARWEAAAGILGDCFAVLAAAAGEAPQRVLSQRGLTVLTQEGNVEGLVDVLFGGKPKGRKN